MTISIKTMAKGAASAALSAAPSTPPILFEDHEDVLVDWLTITHPDIKFLEGFLVGTTFHAENPRGYRNAMQDSLGTILSWGSANRRNPRLDFSGRTLDYRRHETPDQDWTLLSRLLEGGARVTRLDLAKDSTSPVTPAFVARAWRDKRVVTDFRRTYTYGSIDAQDLTIYAGAAKGESQLKIYNKAAELEHCPFARLTRWEFRFRGETAHDIATTLAATPEQPDPETGLPAWPILAFFNSLLSDRMRITEERPDRKNKNYSRVGVDLLWEEFVRKRLPKVQSLVAKVADPWKRLESHLEWLVRSTGANLHKLRTLLGGGAVETVADSGRGSPPSPAWGIADSDPEKARKFVRENLSSLSRAPGGGGPC